VQTGAVSGSYECKVAEDRDNTTTPVYSVDTCMQVPTSDETVSIAAWPEMKELFIKLNTPLPASAAAERLIRNYIQKFQSFFHSNSKNRKKIVGLIFIQRLVDE